MSTATFIAMVIIGFGFLPVMLVSLAHLMLQEIGESGEFE